MNMRIRPATLFLASLIGAISIAASGPHALGQTSEIGRFDRAARSQSERDAIAFIKAYPTSHLIADLFDLLQPETAKAVCTDLAGGGPDRVQVACAGLRSP